MSDEELREVINLLMEQFDNVLRDVVSEEAYLEALPEILHEQVKVERVLSRIILFNCWFGLGNQLLDMRTIESCVEDRIAFGEKDAL